MFSIPTPTPNNIGQIIDLGLTALVIAKKLLSQQLLALMDFFTSISISRSRLSFNQLLSYSELLISRFLEYLPREDNFELAMLLS